MRLRETCRKDFAESRTPRDCRDRDFSPEKHWGDRKNGSYEEDLRIITIGLRQTGIVSYQLELIREGLGK